MKEKLQINVIRNQVNKKTLAETSKRELYNRYRVPRILRVNEFSAQPKSFRFFFLEPSVC